MNRLRRPACRTVAALTAAAILFVPSGASWGRSPILLELMPFLLALLDRALPGGALDFPKSIVTWPDGRQERITLGRLDGHFDQDRLTWVTTIQFPDRDGGRAASSLSPNSASTPDAACRVIVIAFLASAPNVLPSAVIVVDYREAIPDLPAHLADECSAGLGAGSAGSPDPSAPVVVSFVSAHHDQAGPAYIGWRALLDPGTLAWLSRIPVTITRHRPEGITWDDITSEELPSHDVRFTAQPLGRVLDVPCRLSACTVPPELVLRAFQPRGSAG